MIEPGPRLRTLADEDKAAATALDALGQASQARTVFQFLEDYLVGRQRVLDREMFQALEGGKPTDHLLHQKHEVYLFIRNLERLIQNGVKAARTLEPLMQRDEEDAPL